MSMNFLQQLMQGMGGGGTAPAQAAMSAGAGPAPQAAAAPATDDLARMAALSSLQVEPPAMPRAPQTPLPPQASAMNPDIMRMLMQTMSGSQGQPAPSLGQMLAGR